MTSTDPIYVSEDTVLQLHSRIIGRLGGHPGIRDRAALESSLAQPAMRVFGRERFESLHEKAGAYCFFISQNQPFFDGNKRTGFLAALMFLMLNRVIPDFEDAKVFDLLSAAAHKEIDLDKFVAEFVRADKSRKS